MSANGPSHSLYTVTADDGIRRFNQELAEDIYATIQEMSVVSIVHLHWTSRDTRGLVYPLPFRTLDNEVVFPHSGETCVMRDEACAAVEFGYSHPEIGLGFAFVDAWEFVPASNERPFKSVIEELFARRKAIIEDTKIKRLAWEFGRLCRPYPLQFG